jgi:hypothetical protein
MPAPSLQAAIPCAALLWPVRTTAVTARSVIGDTTCAWKGPPRTRESSKPGAHRGRERSRQFSRCDLRGGWRDGTRRPRPRGVIIFHSRKTGVYSIDPARAGISSPGRRPRDLARFAAAARRISNVWKTAFERGLGIADDPVVGFLGRILTSGDRQERIGPLRTCSRGARRTGLWWP